MSHRSTIVGGLDNSAVKKTTISPISNDLVLISTQLEVDHRSIPEDVILGIIESNLHLLESHINTKLRNENAEISIKFIDFNHEKY
jgi:hypothetical protein